MSRFLKFVKVAFIILCLMGMGFVGAFVGYREAEIIENRTAPLLAVKFMVNLRKVERDECSPNLWAMKSAIDEAIIRYNNDAKKICLICSLNEYKFLNDSEPIRQLLTFRIDDLEREYDCRNGPKIAEKLEYFRKIQKEVN